MTGVFEAQPGSGTYLFSAPMFEKVEIHPDHGRKLEIEAPGERSEAAVHLGRPHRTPRLRPRLDLPRGPAPRGQDPLHL
jgi:hypothetical protein